VQVTDSAGLSSSQRRHGHGRQRQRGAGRSADAIAVDEDATSDNLWSLLLGNDRDPDAGDTLSISAVSGSGTLGSLIFDPATQTLRYVADNDASTRLRPAPRRSTASPTR
jgi:hypothetical protein